MPRRRTTEADYQQRLLRAQQLLEQRLDAPIEPAELARAASFSLHHFHRIFHAQMGETVMQHIRRLRLERAARRLRQGEVRVLDLALEAGFESHEAFTRAFSARFGVPPSVFRDAPSERIATWQREAPRPAGPVQVVEYPAIRVAFMRARGSYAEVGALWQQMLARVAALADRIGPGWQLYGSCPDDPDVTAESLLRFDACVTVDDQFVSDGTLAIAEIPAGWYAVGLHRGPYTRLSDTYLDVIGRWFPTSGHEPAPDPVIEHYRNDPACTAEPDLQTEVRVRIAETLSRS